jgi:hypothetical protein
MGHTRHRQLAGLLVSKDGNRIFFATSADGVLWRVMQVPAAGGTPSFTGLEVTGLRYFDLNRDNTKIAFDGLVPTIRPPASDTSTVTAGSASCLAVADRGAQNVR